MVDRLKVLKIEIVKLAINALVLEGYLSNYVALKTILL